MVSRVPLSQGDVLRNSELRALFQCGSRGGIRPSKLTKSIVLVIDHTKGLYGDRFIDSKRLDYVGTGQRGAQRLARMNLVLAQHKQMGYQTLYLFEVFREGEYFYQGEVELVGEPYQDQQRDIDGHLRQVWVFPLQLVRGFRVVPEEYLHQEEAKEAKHARNVKDNVELLRKAEEFPSIPPRVQVTSQTYRRNQYVAEYVKRRAKGKCELCGNPAPFCDMDGNPYLEVHHIEWLSRGGKDTIENAVALCPNCHRKMHVLNEARDVTKLKEVAQVIA